MSTFRDFQDGGRRHLFLKKLEILTVCPLEGANLRHRAKFHKIGQTIAEIWRFNGFQKGGRPSSWILEIQIFLMVWTVKRPILHNHAEFRENRPIRCCDIAFL